ncbi:MAG TPA: DUF3418 domain-containing protein, partial [Phycisphaerales bacterium]|nr:DUF3418 domain-containing protein [Phycisphaerales bacterium]
RAALSDSQSSAAATSIAPPAPPAPSAPARAPSAPPASPAPAASNAPHAANSQHHHRYRLTPLGHKLARFPIDPRLGRMILAAHDLHCLDEVLVIAGALSIQDPRERPGNDRPELQQQADAIHARFKDASSDFLGFLRLWHAYQEAAKVMSSNKLRKWCKDHFLNYLRMREWEDLHQQLHTLAADVGLHHAKRGRVPGLDSSPSESTSSDPSSPPGPPSSPQDLPTTPAFRARFEPIHRALLTGLITSVGRKSDTPPTFEYEGPRSTRFAIFPGSGLFKTSQRWVMASELVRTSRLYARTLAAIRPEWIERTAEHLVKRTHHDPYWDPSRAGGQVMAFERVTLFGLELVKRRLVHFGPIEPATARGLFIHHALVGGEYITDAEWFDHNRRLVQRVAEMENKARRRGLLVDSARRYAFYDDRIGPEVVSAATFEQWRRRAEQRNPRILFMSVADLLDPGSALPEAADFPDSLTAQSVFGEPIRLHVDYAFEPGAPRDGLTVTLTSSQVERFDPRPLEWLVPGLLAEKIAELIRTLPKSLRAAFVPAPRFAEQCVEALTFGKGDLLEELRLSFGLAHDL